MANVNVGAPWAVNISDNFQNKFETALMGYSGAWEKLIYEKNLESKISWHCHFKSGASIAIACSNTSDFIVLLMHVAASQHGVWITQLNSHKMICFHNCSMIKDENYHSLKNIGFSYDGKLAKIKSVPGSTVMEQQC